MSTCRQQPCYYIWVAVQSFVLHKKRFQVSAPCHLRTKKWLEIQIDLMFIVSNVARQHTHQPLNKCNWLIILIFSERWINTEYVHIIYHTKHGNIISDHNHHNTGICYASVCVKIRNLLGLVRYRPELQDISDHPVGVLDHQHFCISCLSPWAAAT